MKPKTIFYTSLIACILSCIIEIYEKKGPPIGKNWIEIPVKKEVKKQQKIKKEIKDSKIITKKSINKVSLEEIDNVPKISKKTARKIILYRQKNKKIRSLNELKKIKGIKEKTIQKLSLYFYV